MLELYRILWRLSWRRQLRIIALSLAVAALAAAPLEFQKRIVNAIDLGTTLAELYALGAGMIGVVLLSLFLKFLLGLDSNLLGENVVRDLRKRAHAEHAAGAVDGRGAGTLVTMVSSEAEDLGHFVGAAFAQPVVEIGTLASVIGFIAVSEPALGLLALAVVLPQAAIVAGTQRRVNRLLGERIRLLRRAADRMTAAARAEADAGAIADFDAIHATRRRIFGWKLSTKFLVAALNAAGTVGTLMLGGWLVIEGRTDVGTVVAATIALARLQGPWTALVAFYRRASAMRVRFALFRDALAPR